MVWQLFMRAIFNKFSYQKEFLETLGALFVASIIAIPILAIFYIAFSADDNIWTHLASTVLPGYIITTVIVISGVSIITLLIGVSLAWIITVYEFPFRRIMEWLCLLPLAMPAYIVAYTYGDFLDYTGFVQSNLRFLFGWDSIKDYWFPDIYSIGGSIFIMAFVLYPYIYITSRAAFLRQSITLIEMSSILGKSSLYSFFHIALPMARPAIIIGLILVIMETMNEFAAFEYFGVDTLSVGVYITWLGKNNLGGAAQIAIFMLLFVFLLMMIEKGLRKKRSFTQNNKKQISANRIKLSKGRLVLVMIICILPVLIGFLLPSLVLFDFILERIFEVELLEYSSLLFNSLFLSICAAILTTILGIFLVNTHSTSNNLIIRLSVTISRLGYALPGVVLAIGVIVPLIAVDGVLRNIFGQYFNITIGLFLSGTLMAIIYAYIVRFLTISFGTIESGFATLNPDITAASRSLGKSKFSTLIKIQLPIIKPALIMSALLVFVDSMKELPATLILRPFNFDTLATNVYTYASLSDIGNASLPAMTIVVAGLFPIILINRELNRGRKG
jgi:iron(III) transport system permease protein